MLPWVIAHPGATVTEVTERFGYSGERELAQDLNLVFVCGLPGYGPGELMEAFIDEDEVVVDLANYFSTPLRLNPTEALTLLAAGMAMLGSGHTPKALEQGVAKLTKALLGDNKDSLVVELAAEPEHLADLRTAVSGHRVVRLVYTGLGSGETTERDIEPWSVFTTLGNWYVSGFCRMANAERVFRVDRIRAADLADETFEAPARQPDPVVNYTPGEEDVRSVIRLSNRARWVTEYYPVEIISEEEGEVVIRFSSADASVAARLLLRLGADASLVEGAEVAEVLADLRKRILERYGASAV